MRLLVGEPEPSFRQATAYLAETQKMQQRVLISNLVVCEAYFACQHHYQMRKHEVLQALHILLSQSVFFVENSTLALLGSKGMAKAKPGFVDRLIHDEYSTQGLGLLTCERAAIKLDRAQILKSSH